MKKAVIAVAGLGYTGLSNALLFSVKNRVFAVDIIPEKVEKINAHKSPIADKSIEEYLKRDDLKITATSDGKEAYKNADIVIIATPTDYDIKTNGFDTSSVENVISVVKEVNEGALIVIRSTVPIGYTKMIRQKMKFNHILFAPEFLREGKALYDNLYPSRIIIGTDFGDSQLMELADNFANILRESAVKKDIPILLTESTEAEAIKLFSNTYLAMRVAFFNEIDTYIEAKQLNAKQIIEGMGLDPRIGNQYNNPSFGYGGYCLPKDSKQTAASFENIPGDLIKAIINSNRARKEFIAERIIERTGFPQNIHATVGIYRLVMKAGSDNFRESAVLEIMEIIRKKGMEVLIYEPVIEEKFYNGFEIVNDFAEFSERCTIVVANRVDEKSRGMCGKLYTRDIYGTD